MGKGMTTVTQGCVFDSNILIYHMNDQLDPEAHQAVLDLFDGPVYVSVISRIEVLAWRGHSDESRELADALMRNFIEIGLNDTIVRKTIDIRRFQRVKLPDAIIAASAVSLDLPLVTRNITDFGRVEDLRLINPFSRVRHQP
jgi:predicted nucleic acid-binding protein